MTSTRNRHTETIVYISLWLIAIGLYLLTAMRSRAQLSQPLLDLQLITSIATTILPFLILFLINNLILIPRLLFRNKFTLYFIATAAVILLTWLCQYFSFMHEVAASPWPFKHNPIPHPRHVTPLLPMPLFLDFTYALLVIGCNLACALMFQRFDDKLEHESLMKTSAESRLSYLKAQINPHFYMNMLNNIHGMIEINPDKAQNMVLDMSRLMRYMLYDSSRPLISLADEVTFLSNYLNVMRQRFPENRLSIDARFPSEAEMQGISIPPLLFLVFIENAFKHGVSYRENSFVAISVEINNSTLLFSCQNSNHSSSSPADDSLRREGIGLRNVSQRLSLLYGSKANLTIQSSPSVYTVLLTIPCHETTDSDN